MRRKCPRHHRPHTCFGSFRRSIRRRCAPASLAGRTSRTLGIFRRTCRRDGRSRCPIACDTLPDLGGGETFRFSFSRLLVSCFARVVRVVVAVVVVWWWRWKVEGESWKVRLVFYTCPTRVPPPPRAKNSRVTDRFSTFIHYLRPIISPQPPMQIVQSRIT